MRLYLELFRLSLALFLGKYLPLPLKIRLCRFIYNYNSKNISGIDIVIPYQPISRLSDLKIWVNTKEFIGWNLFFLKKYEQDTNIVLYNHIKPGFFVLEAGSHIGSETLLIANIVGKQGKVFAFEPNPKINMILDINCRINNFQEIVNINNIALGEDDKRIEFYVNDQSASNQGMSSKYKFNHDANKIEVEQQTLDHWIKNNQVTKLDFIKMDVQGAEIDILKGGTETLKKFKPIIFAEADKGSQNDADTSLHQLYLAIVQHDYEVFSIIKGGKLLPINLDNICTGNWLAVPAKK